MRKWNARISLMIIVLLLIHGVSGGFQLMGVLSGGKTWRGVLSYCMVALICVHIINGIFLTWESLRAGRKARVSYLKENRIFWTRRISGFAMILLIVFHLMLFVQKSSSDFRLQLFEGQQLAASLLLVIVVGIHVLSNIRPLYVALGAGWFRCLVRDILFIASIVIIFCAVAFIVYYLRWNVFWQ